MLALEDNDANKLYLAKGLPREWVGSGKEIRIEHAPTRWGRVSFKMAGDMAAKRVTAAVTLARPAAGLELHVKVRTPESNKIVSATVNGKAATIGGTHNDTVIFPAGAATQFDMIALTV